MVTNCDHLVAGYLDTQPSPFPFLRVAGWIIYPLLTMKPTTPLETLILTLRQQKVILDSDLAGLYGVPTKRLNEQIKRNADRFPSDFMFQLSVEEWAHLKPQIATSSLDNPQKTGDTPNRSQIATGSQRHRDPRFLPYAFT